jgi:hypothetical protein
MPTIKTYIKGAPFYIASSYRNVAFTLVPKSICPGSADAGAAFMDFMVRSLTTRRFSRLELILANPAHTLLGQHRQYTMTAQPHTNPNAINAPLGEALLPAYLMHFATSSVGQGFLQNQKSQAFRIISVPGM